MNKLVMLNEIRKEKKEINLSINNNYINGNKTNSCQEEYLNFKNVIIKNDSILESNLDENNCITSFNQSKLNRAISRIFLLKNKNPFLDLINEIFDDCLGTNCSVEYIYDLEEGCCLKDGILKNPSNDIAIRIKDDYRLFEYNIQLQTCDYENIAITITRDDLSSNCSNIINFDKRKKQYSINNEIEGELAISDSNAYLIMVNSNIRVPDSYEVSEECNGSKIIYKLNILKSWKYDFKKLYEKNLYMLFPLKVFDLKKCVTYMKEYSYSDELIKKEIDRFFIEMNKYLNKIKEKKIMTESDIDEFNAISYKLLGDFIN